jgi:dolichol-phosphate mannosyltransferase
MNSANTGATASRERRGSIQKKLVSVCAPAYNESECIDELARRLGKVFDSLADRYDFEAIICENGSEDDTYEKLLQIRERDPRFKIVRLSRNFGAEGGVTAALAHARGAAAVIMNSDLQDPPEYIPDFIEKWEQGFQNVYAVVAQRTGESRFRRLCAHGYYRIVDWLSDTPAPRNVSDFRLVDRVAYETYLDLPERYRMIRFMWPWIGFRSIGIDTVRPERHAGKSSFRLLHMLRSALRSILAQSRAPLTIIPTFGMLLAGLSFALLIGAVVKAVFYGVPFDGYGTIISVVLMLFGFLFLFLGMLAEYVGLIYEEVRHRPTFIVSETAGLDGRYARGSGAPAVEPFVVPRVRSDVVQPRNSQSL